MLRCEMERELIQVLNKLLANYFVMYVKLHRYKWYAKGEHVLFYQSFYEELYQMIKVEIDLLAAHILSLDGEPFATMIKFLKEATIVEASADDEEVEMMEKLTADFTHICDEIMEKGVTRAQKVNDLGTVQFLLEQKGKFAAYVWKLKAYHKS